MVEKNLNETAPLLSPRQCHFGLQLVVTRAGDERSQHPENMSAKVKHFVDDKSAQGGEPQRSETLQPIDPERKEALIMGRQFSSGLFSSNRPAVIMMARDAHQRSVIAEDIIVMIKGEQGSRRALWR